MGADYPVGIWGNSYDAFYWGDDAGPQRLHGAAGEVPEGRVPVVVGDPGLHRHAVPGRGDQEGRTARTPTRWPRRCSGSPVDTPVGKLTIREKDHQANRGQLYGKTVMDPKYPFAIMKPVDVRRSRRSSWTERLAGRPGGRASRGAPDRSSRPVHVPDPSFVFAQSLSGLTAAMFLFLIASGLSLIFGVLRVLNFAHGTFYMLGAYSRVPVRAVAGPGPGTFWLAALGAAARDRAAGRASSSACSSATSTARRSSTSSCSPTRSVLILSDAAKIIWGTQQKSVSRPPGLDRLASRSSAPPSPTTTCFILLLGPGHRARLLVRAAAHARRAASSGPPRSTARRWARSASTSTRSTRGCSCSPRSWAGSAAPSSRPMRAIVPGMDTEIIVEAFVVVVIGGLGSFWGTFLGALDLRPGAVVRHPVLPALLDLLGLRPHGRPCSSSGPGACWDGRSSDARWRGCPGARWCSWPRSSCRPLGSRFYTFLANDVVDLGAVRHQPQSAGRATPGSCPSATPPTSASAPTRPASS